MESIDSEYALQEGIQEPTLWIKLRTDLAESVKLRQQSTQIGCLTCMDFTPMGTAIVSTKYFFDCKEKRLEGVLSTFMG